MNYNEAQEYLKSFRVFGAKLGFGRILELMRRLSNVQNKMKYVHVAGTNGKGSHVFMLSKILEDAGYKVGTFISPYVFDFCERMSVCSQNIDKETVCRLLDKIKIEIDGMIKDGFESPTEFEVITAMAFLYFYEQKCDIVVLEVGLGGRFDSTNIIENTLLSIITSISLDHTDVLGDTIKKIAYQKAGIIKNNSNVVLYPLQKHDAKRVIKKVSKEKNSQLIIAKKPKIIKSDIEENIFCYDGKEYKTNLLGKHQIFNAASVIESAKVLRKLGFNITDENIYNGILNTDISARIEVISHNPFVILDASHNKDGVLKLAELLKKNFANKNITFVFGMLKDKQYDFSVKTLSKIANNFIAIKPNSPRAQESKVIYDIAKNYCDNCFYYDRISEAVEKAFEFKDDIIVICGSFYLIKEARDAAKKFLN